MKYCIHCGTEANGNFCAECGKPLNRVSESPDISEWEDECNLESLLSINSVHHLVTYNYSLSQRNDSEGRLKSLSEVGDIVLGPITGYSPFKLASALMPLANYAANISHFLFGAEIKSSKEDFIEHPAGRVLVSLLCFFACNGQRSNLDEQKVNRCVVGSIIPVSILNHSAVVTVSVRKKGSGVNVKAEIHTKGQFDDWGRSDRYLNRLFFYISEFSDNFPVIIKNFKNDRSLERITLGPNYIEDRLAAMNEGKRFDAKQQLREEGEVIGRGFRALRELDESDETEPDKLPREAELTIYSFDSLSFPESCYLVIDRTGELVTCLLKDFSELGIIPP